MCLLLQPKHLNRHPERLSALSIFKQLIITLGFHISAVIYYRPHYLSIKRGLLSPLPLPIHTPVVPLRPGIANAL